MKGYSPVHTFDIRHGNEPFGSVLVKDDHCLHQRESIFLWATPTWHGWDRLILEVLPWKRDHGSTLHIHSIPVVSPALCAAGAARWYGRNWDTGYAARQPGNEQILDHGEVLVPGLCIYAFGHQPVVRSLEWGRKAWRFFVHAGKEKQFWMTRAWLNTWWCVKCLEWQLFLQR